VSEVSERHRISFQAFHVYGGGGGGGGSRLPGTGGVGGTTGAAGVTYADSVRSPAPFEVIGRPLRPSHPQLQQQHRHHHHQYARINTLCYIERVPLYATVAQPFLILINFLNIFFVFF